MTWTALKIEKPVMVQMVHSWRHVSNLRSLVLGDPVIGRRVEVYFYQLKLHSKSKNNLIKALFGMGPYPSTHSNIWRKTHWDGDGCDFLIFSATFHFIHFYDSIRLDGVSRDSFTWLEATSIIQICFIDTFKITGGKGSKYMGQVSILVITEGWISVPTLQGVVHKDSRSYTNSLIKTFGSERWELKKNWKKFDGTLVSGIKSKSLLPEKPS